MDVMSNDPTVSTDWLAERLDDANVIVIDATWFMPGTPRNARAEHAERHIPGAVFFDIDEISDHANPLPHMLAEPPDFAVHARRLGVEPDSKVVVYDAQGLFSAPRVWWNFRAMGHDAVWVLDGGLPKWIAEARPLEEGWPENAHGEFKAHFNPDLLRSIDQVRAALDGGSSAGRGCPLRRPGFARRDPRTPRRAAWRTHAGRDQRSGLLDHRRWPPGRQRRARTRVLGRGRGSEGADHHQLRVWRLGGDPVAGLARLGHWNTPIYDGSWTEWGGRTDTPVAVG